MKKMYNAPRNFVFLSQKTIKLCLIMFFLIIYSGIRMQAWAQNGPVCDTYTNITTTNGLGNNIVRWVYASGSTVYAATTGGLSISTDGGASFTNKTTTNGLGNNTVRGV